MELIKYIRDVQDFPKKGILFKDISPLLADGNVLRSVIDQMSELSKDADIIIGPDARGFLFGTPVAAMLKKPFIMVRKPNKLPGPVISMKYDLEYGSNILEVQEGMIKPGQKAIIIDDVLATGGTTRAIINLVESQGATVEKIVLLMELEELKGRELLAPYKVESLIKIKK
ncbi:adenine phosphoribosyltransferase [Mesomycoplasma lagogenitalium]|uniref:Adenine phosphoribosyltransferase n=1 Tax=Mesomycoplasma lagogenitalium TaxID=171286 RepID=A0ABY8LSZ0_9BACT|nr:adenine phosphoribosyltransferase [Mesomycoplasma lagogenitalium]WGI36366.1 adenine phosphoribosyltransferase [Mesomycoplasma lagogenitalium]